MNNEMHDMDEDDKEMFVLDPIKLSFVIVDMTS